MAAADVGEFTREGDALAELFAWARRTLDSVMTRCWKSWIPSWAPRCVALGLA